MSSRLRTIALAGLLPLLASCNVEKDILKVEDARVALNPVEGRPSALYFTIHGGPKDADLLSVVSEDVIRIEIHETVKDEETGAMRMVPLEKVAVPAGEDVVFKQGGKHVMLWGMNRVPIQMGELDVEFIFSNGDRQAVTAPVASMGGEKPTETSETGEQE